jgi:hypothetical protein
MAPTRPPLSPAVAVNPPALAAAAASPDTTPTLVATAGPVLHPTLPRVAAAPSPAATTGR